MRLRQLKLSGFKSFADTTLIEFPGSLAGIVGPNGCGKSNVIDAIRWVLGEGRVSELRGTSSMSELIFSGSSNRARSARASVEMVLDNSDGSVQGPWGSYSEISVKRVVTRDGANAYLINGQQVRRRDVQDIFMGTGLGPRSYAIISQGMISNFIKARPEDLRIYLEEAAGVSKYKERRRETETSLNSTRDNLQKVAYLQETKREEVERLTVEAKTAQKWLELEGKRLEAEQLLTYVQNRDALEAKNKLDLKISEKEEERLSHLGESQQLEQEADTLRQKAFDARMQTDRARQAKFDADKRVAEIEGNIRHILERKDAIGERLESDARTIENREQEAAEAEQHRIELMQEAEELEAEAEQLRLQSASIEEMLIEREEVFEDSRRAYEASRSATSEAERKLSVISVQMQALERELRDVTERRETLQEEARQTKAPDAERLERLKTEIAESRTACESIVAQGEAVAAELEQKRQEAMELSENRQRLSQSLGRISGHIQTLLSINEKAEQEGKLPEWLRKMGLDNLSRFYEHLKIDSHWSRAFEAILSVRALALPIRLDYAEGFSLDLPPSKLSFYSDETAGDAPADEDNGLLRLTDFVTVSDPGVRRVLGTWLHGVYAAETLQEALSLRHQLKAGDRCVTAQGHVVDAVSVSFYAEGSESESVISRVAEIERLTQKESELRAELSLCQDREKELGAGIVSLETQVRELRKRWEEARRNGHELEIEESRLTAERRAWESRSVRVQEEIEKLALRIEEINERRDAVEMEFETLDEALAIKQQAQSDAQTQLEEIEHRVADLQGSVREKKDAARLAQVNAAAARTRSEDAARSIERARQEVRRLTDEDTTLRQELETLDEEAEREGLMEVTRALDEAKVALLAAQSASDAAEEALEQCRLKRDELQAGLAPLMEEISDYKVKRQGWLTMIEALEVHLNEINADREALEKRVLEEEAKQPQLKARLTRLTEAIALLGPVNHQALENLEVARRAMQETERQVSDLNAAIANLEATIRKIDAETRELLRSTFDTVNLNFSTMFTGLFGGGSAELRMTGEEILDTGIEVIAQPPGKRNANVKLLSGGEQALTATALVFAIFKLNPAPFCLLDEVDAPLDEANQDRLARRITEMSSQTQFMMITHHRVTMEHLQQLVGVTMKEPGVSRVVAVDIAEATRIAQS